ncbi:MAG: NAD(P)/FAD-dependent oxidoreductase [Bryobacteraceae bacterium]
MNQVQIIGAGPAGSTAAISALLHGASVELIEKSRFPRHKVCGEFLSPEIIPALDRLGVLAAFEKLSLARIRRMELNFGSKPKIAHLPEAAFGLSRYAYDRLLYDRAVELGATALSVAPRQTNPRIWTAGRRVEGGETRGKRVFGFKAHFTGPSHDAVELYFFKGCYVGINCVENGVTNVCGLGPEELLRGFNFEVDELVHSFRPLTARLNPLQRSMKWLNVGPLIFQNHLNREAEPGVYTAGDALSFVDPFTGSGLLSAAITGELAGSYAAKGLTSSDHRIACRKALAGPFGVSSLFRAVSRTQWAEHLAGLVPGAWLYQLTRPRLTT